MLKLKLKLKIIIASAAVIVVVGVAGAVYLAGMRESGIDFAVAEKTDLVQEVSVTGRVAAVESVELSFEASGKIALVSAGVGDKVSRGQILARLENADILAELAQNEAAIKVAEAKFDELVAGTRPEEIKIAEVKVANARTAVTEAGKNLIDKINDAFLKSDDAIRNKADQIFSNPRSAGPQLKFLPYNNQLEIDLESDRPTIEGLLNEWAGFVAILTGSSDLDLYVLDAKNNLNLIKSFLEKSALAVNGAQVSPDLTQTTIDTWKTDIAAARTNINTATVNLTAAEEKLSGSASSLAVLENELELDLAGATVEQIAAETASVEEAEAKKLATEARLAKTAIYSPISGIVTSQAAKVGQIVAANTAVVSVISALRVEIETFITEVDIPKVKLGDPARVTLDAYGRDEEFPATVSEIDPAETVREGVATYKVILNFDAPDNRIRVGMTANVDIETAKRAGVFAVPARAVISRDGGKILRILKDDGAIEERLAQTGLRASDGRVEITEGLAGGEKAIIFLPDNIEVKTAILEPAQEQNGDLRQHLEDNIRRHF